MEIPNPLLHPFAFIYQLIQWFLNKLLSPEPPKPGAELDRPKIAVIGAGLTGVSAASHCVGHGFDVQIFEAGPRQQLGGIWSVSIPRRLSLFSRQLKTNRTSRESTPRPASKSTPLCTDSTPLSTGVAGTPTANK
jgi:NAD(P)-binding Rossmann-like domain